MSRRISRVAAFAVCLVGPSVLSGQASATAYAQYVPGNTAPPPNCGTTSAKIGTNTAQAAANCVGGTGLFDARASSNRGQIKAFASASVTNNASTGQQQRWQAFGSASWNDQLVVTSGTQTPSFLQFVLRISGALSASASGTGCGYGIEQSSYYFSASGGVTDQWNSPQNFGARSGPNCYNNFQPLLQQGSTSLRTMFTNTYLIPIVSGAAKFGYSMNTASFLLADPTSSASLSLDAIGDFEHTIDVVGINLLGQNGADITNQVVFSFVNGTQLSPTVTAPEPTTLALVTLGALVLAVARRRRTRAAE